METSVQSELGQAIAEYFQTHADWPRVRHLQRRFRQSGSIERIAADAGVDLIRCQSPNDLDAHCALTLRGFASYAPGSPETEHFLAAARYAAKRYLEEDQPPTINSAELGAQLDLNPAQLKKLGRLILTWGGFWGSASGPGPDGTYSFTPNRDSWYFEEVGSIDAFERARSKAAEDAAYASRKQHERHSLGALSETGVVREGGVQYAVEGEGFAITLSRFNLIANPSIRSLLMSDAQEINRLFRQRSWKSVGFLAGSCCEGVLIDLLEREEPRTSDRLGSNWRFAKGLAHLVSAAQSFAILSDLTADIARFIKAWRDLIHPWKAPQFSRRRIIRVASYRSDR